MSLSFISITQFNQDFIQSYDSDDSELTLWLNTHALNNERKNISKTFFVKNGKDVVGFYTLATGAILNKDLGLSNGEYPKYPLPTIIIARLVIQKKFRKYGIGTQTLFHIFNEVLEISKKIAVLGVHVESKNEHSTKFYKKRGFQMLPDKKDGRSLMFIFTKQIEEILQNQ